MFNKYSGGDLQSSLYNNKFLKHFSTGKYPGELHLRTLNPFNKTNPAHNYTGTNIDKRLENYNDIMNNYYETGNLNINPIPTFDSIPIIDIAPILNLPIEHEEFRKISNQIANACKKVGNYLLFFFVIEKNPIFLGFFYIINHGMFILPSGKHQFKVGSTYEWSFKNSEPSAEGRNQIENFLKKILKVNFEIINHYAAIRPTVQDRRPVTGLHPDYSAIGIFNGLGTKGVTLAPYYASQFVEFLIGKSGIGEEVNVMRVSKN